MHVLSDKPIYVAMDTTVVFLFKADKCQRAQMNGEY